MKTIDLDKLQPDPIAAAVARADKDVVTVSGYICAVSETSISMSMTRDDSSCREYPRSAVIAAFTDEETEQVTLLVDAKARVRAISTLRMEDGIAQLRPRGGTCGTTCKSGDGSATCCCGVGERCRSLVATCLCEDASRASPVKQGFAAAMGPTDAAPVGFAAQAAFGAGSLMAAPGNWYCRTGRGVCPIVCYPIVVNGRVVDSWCYCDCTNPIPDKTTG